MNVQKEHYICAECALHVCGKRPINMRKETNECAERALHVCRMCPICVRKESYICNVYCIAVCCNVRMKYLIVSHTQRIACYIVLQCVCSVLQHVALCV